MNIIHKISKILFIFVAVLILHACSAGPANLTEVQKFSISDIKTEGLVAEDAELVQVVPGPNNELASVFIYPEDNSMQTVWIDSNGERHVSEVHSQIFQPTFSLKGDYAFVTPGEENYQIYLNGEVVKEEKQITNMGFFQDELAYVMVDDEFQYYFDTYNAKYGPYTFIMDPITHEKGGVAFIVRKESSIYVVHNEGEIGPFESVYRIAFDKDGNLGAVGLQGGYFGVFLEDGRGYELENAYSEVRAAAFNDKGEFGFLGKILSMYNTDWEIRVDNEQVLSTAQNVQQMIFDANSMSVYVLARNEGGVQALFDNKRSSTYVHVGLMKLLPGRAIVFPAKLENGSWTFVDENSQQYGEYRAVSDLVLFGNKLVFAAEDVDGNIIHGTLQ